MAYRCEKVILYKETVVCDDCGTTSELGLNDIPMGFDRKMNMTLGKGYTFKNFGDGAFKNYCRSCKGKYLKTDQ